MPGFNGTGPQGQGPVTGRGWGNCAFNWTGLDRFRGGRGFWRSGMGRGFRNWFWATGLPRWLRAGERYAATGRSAGMVSKEEEIDFLRSEADFLKRRLENTEKLLRDTESQTDSGPK